MKTNPIRWYCSGICAAALLCSLAVQAEDAAPAFPDPATATLKDGIFPIKGNLRNVAVGLNKDQMQALLGPPHFHEGIFRVRTWNYLFKFRKDSEAISCQYQVRFDDAALVAGTYWKDEQCANLAASD